jgi:hypothetical protein
MVSIHITTFIEAPMQRVYDLSRHLSVLRSSMLGTPAQANSGGSNLLFQSGDVLTYHSRNLGRSRIMRVRITDMDGRTCFNEELVKGDMTVYKHEHHFKPTENGTIMIDLIEADGPRDLIGRIAAKFALKGYLDMLVKKRIELIRLYAESEKWKAVLAGLT